MKIIRTDSHERLIKKAGSFSTTIVLVDPNGQDVFGPDGYEQEVEVMVNYTADRYVPATWDSPDEGGGIVIDSVMDATTGEDITNSVSQIDLTENLPEAIATEEGDREQGLRDDHFDQKMEDDRLEETKPMRGRTSDYKLPYSADDTWDRLVNDSNSGELSNKRQDYLNDQLEIGSNKNRGHKPEPSPSNAKFDQLFNKDKKRQPAFARSENNMKVLKTSSYKKIALDMNRFESGGMLGENTNDSTLPEDYSFQENYGSLSDAQKNGIAWKDLQRSVMREPIAGIGGSDYKIELIGSPDGQSFITKQKKNYQTNDFDGPKEVWLHGGNAIELEGKYGDWKNGEAFATDPNYSSFE
jgi:hypothetical protein